MVEMSSPIVTEPAAESHHPPGSLQLTNWPLRDDAPPAWSSLIGAAALAGLAGWLSGSGAMGLLSFAALAVSLWRYWIPVVYEFGPRGVAEFVLTRRRRISWRAIARYEVRRRGVLLLADAGHSPLAPLRSLYIRWGRQREELLAIVEYYLGARNSRR
jgi:hypothetical protein